MKQATGPDTTRADRAWEAHRALMFAEARDPALRANPRWQRIRRAAFIDYKTELERA